MYRKCYLWSLHQNKPPEQELLRNSDIDSAVSSIAWSDDGAGKFHAYDLMTSTYKRSKRPSILSLIHFYIQFHDAPIFPRCCSGSWWWQGEPVECLCWAGVHLVAPWGSSDQGLPPGSWQGAPHPVSGGLRRRQSVPAWRKATRGKASHVNKILNVKLKLTLIHQTAVKYFKTTTPHPALPVKKQALTYLNPLMPVVEFQISKSCKNI